MSKRLQSCLRNGLLAFVLVSIGFMLGKHSGGNGAPPDQPGAARTDTAADTAAPRDRVRVYYLHTTFRCATCNTIEKMARAVVEEQFGDELATGRVEWREADFQEDEPLAKQFGVVASCVVVARMRGAATMEFTRLDEVWTLMSDPPKFNARVADVIRECLSAVEESG
jgi:hypothetical protein